MSEANARIVIDKLLRESDWVLSGDDGVVNVDTEKQNEAGFADYVLKNCSDFPLCIVEAKAALVDWNYEFSIFVSLCLLKPKNQIIVSDYLAEILNTSFVYNQAVNFTKSGTVSNLHLVEIKNIKIPLPSMDTQKEIVDLIRNEKVYVDGARKLKENYTKKIQDKLSKIWGE